MPGRSCSRPITRTSPAACRARRGRTRAPRHASLVVAAERHDDGWAVWEQSPLIDAGRAQPLNFLDVQVPAHLAFYRAGIAADHRRGPVRRAARLDARRRHLPAALRRADPELKLSARRGGRRTLVEAFVAEQEADACRRACEQQVSTTSSAGPTTAASRSTTGSRSSSACGTSRRARPSRTRAASGLEPRRAVARSASTRTRSLGRRAASRSSAAWSRSSEWTSGRRSGERVPRALPAGAARRSVVEP